MWCFQARQGDSHSWTGSWGWESQARVLSWEGEIKEDVGTVTKDAQFIC